MMAGDPTPDIFIGSDTKVEYREERISIGHGDYVSKYRPAEILQIAARWTEHARSLGWILFLHAMVDHGLAQDQLDGAHIVVSASGSRVWRLRDGRPLFDVWEPEHLHRERRRRMGPLRPS